MVGRTSGPSRRRAPALAGVLAALCATAGLAASAALGAGSSTVRASLVPSRSGHGFVAPGTRVPAADLGVRVFLNGRRGIAINTGMSLQGVTYPVATTDGGRTWRVDGPGLHIPAANAPNVVTQVTAMRPNTYVVYGGPTGANSVVVSADGGRHWYRAYLGGIVGAVAGDNGRLYAFTGQRGAYVSSDRGRTWRYSPSFP